MVLNFNLDLITRIWYQLMSYHLSLVYTGSSEMRRKRCNMPHFCVGCRNMLHHAGVFNLSVESNQTAESKCKSVDFRVNKWSYEFDIGLRQHRHRRRTVQSYSPGGANVPSHAGTLAPPGEYDWTCASFGPPKSTTQTANWSVQQFLHSSRRMSL